MISFFLHIKEWQVKSKNHCILGMVAKTRFTPGKANWLTEISVLAGGENIFADHKEANVQSDWEEVLKRNPHHVCLAWVGVQTNKVNPTILHKRPNWSDMPAIKEHRVYVLEEWLYCRPSPRLLLGLKTRAASSSRYVSCI